MMFPLTLDLSRRRLFVSSSCRPSWNVSMYTFLALWPSHFTFDVFNSRESRLVVRLSHPHIPALFLVVDFKALTLFVARINKKPQNMESCIIRVVHFELSGKFIHSYDSSRTWYWCVWFAWFPQRERDVDTVLIFVSTILPEEAKDDIIDLTMW